jgi:LysR family transcriptional regulator, regulator of abg operon
MRLTQIRDFVAVIHAGSLRGAARIVGVSQPAITKSIRQLEDELGVRLLQRNARGAAATPAGKAFLARARVVQAELRKAIDDLAAFQGGSEGSVSFGTASQASMLVVPEAMQNFRQRFPNARVRVIEGVGTSFMAAVRDETLDFALAGSPPQPLDPALRFKPLLRLPLVVAGRAGHPLRGATSLRELVHLPWLMYYPLGAGGMLEKAFTAIGQPMPRSIVQCESYATALSLLARTDTVGLIAPGILKTAFGPYPLQQIRVKETIPAPLLGLYTRSDAPLTAAAACMSQAISAAARRLVRN